MKNVLARIPADYLVPTIAGVLALLIHAILNPHYGFFRDELYFIICGRHPDWGYVDQPPVVPLLAAASQAFGVSLFLVRSIPAIFAACGVFVTARLVVAFGGGVFAQILASLCLLLAPVLAVFGLQLGPDTVGLWLWPLAALYVTRLVQGADPRLWLAVGAILGIAGEAKYSVLFFGVALLIGIAVSPSRRVLLTPWMPAGIVLALAIVAPNVAWQASHGWPMIELLQNGQHGKNVILTPLQFVLADVAIFNPLLSLVWIAGLVLAFVRPAMRWIAWTFSITMIAMIALHAKDYYPADAFPLVFACGAIAVEWATQRLRALRPVVLGLATIAGAAFVPLVLPLLDEPHLEAYAHAAAPLLGVPAEEHHRSARIPTDLADMHGWPEMTAAVAGVYDALSPRDRAIAAINASNYGEASAINLFGPAYGLPTASSGHNQYWIWGPHFHRGDVLIDVNGDASTLNRVCANVTLGATFSDEWNMPYESDIPIYVCRGLDVDVAKVWPLVRNYN